MKTLGTIVTALAFAGATQAVLAADEAQSQDQKRQQMHEQCKANPQECHDRMQKRMQEWFKKVDKDADGSISREEAKASAPRVDEHFDEIDANHDGKVTREELQAYHQKRHEQRHAEHAGQPGSDKQQGGDKKQ